MSIGEFWAQGNLIALYHLEDLTDSSASSYTLTNNNSVTFTAGKFSNGANFGATNSDKSLTRTDQLGLGVNDNRTIHVWFKCLATPANGTFYTLFCNAYTANDRLYQISFDGDGSGGIQAAIGHTRAGVSDELNTSLMPGAESGWHMVSLSINGTTYKVYYDGAQLGSDGTLTQSNGSDADCGDGTAIGQLLYTGFERWASVMVDEVAVFDRVLTDAEIRRWYAWSKGRLL